MPKKGRRGSSKNVAKKTQDKMKSSCMWGGNSAISGLSGSGATGYGNAIYGPANAQTNDGMGSNHIKLADPAVVWKGGQRGGDPTVVNIPDGSTGITISYTPPASSGGSRGGSMLGAAIVPAALLAANQLYKPSRALKNLSYSRKNGFRKTMKKFRKGRR
jgi:hypothetical protein